MSDLPQVYLNEDYRDSFKVRLNQLKHVQGKKFSVHDMAETCSMQRTYLSKVLNKGAHLNDDQFFMAVEYLGFNDEEAEFLELSHAYQRSDLRRRKQALKKKLLEEQGRQLRTEKVIEADVIHPDSLTFSEYYLDPQIQLVHMFFTIKAYRRDPMAVQQQLNLDPEKFQEIIDKLVAMKLISYKNQRVENLKEQIFLSADSPIARPYHSLAKFSAAARISEIPESKSRKLSVVFSCTPKEYQEINQKLVELYKYMEEIVAPVEAPTQVYQLSYDLFPWTEGS